MNKKPVAWVGENASGEVVCVDTIRNFFEAWISGKEDESKMFDSLEEIRADFNVDNLTVLFYEEE